MLQMIYLPWASYTFSCNTWSWPLLEAQGWTRWISDIIKQGYYLILFSSFQPPNLFLLKMSVHLILMPSWLQTESKNQPSLVLI